MFPTLKHLGFLFILYLATISLLCSISDTYKITYNTSFPVPVTPKASSHKQSVGSLNKYRKNETPNDYELTYEFIDYEGQKHEITFTISKHYFEHANKQYGYDKKAIIETLNTKVRTVAAKLLTDSGLSDCMKITVEEDSIGCEFTASSSTMNEIQESAEELVAKLIQMKKKLYEEELNKHGMIIVGNEIQPDYSKLVTWFQTPLDICYKALKSAGTGYDSQKYLGLFIAFLQEVKYEIAPSIWADKTICGLWTSPEVLVNNHGDCDSKSIAFASLWKHFPNSSTIVVMLPTHMLVGVAMNPNPGQEFVRIGMKYYILCEVAGPGKLYPGYQDSVKGTFKYTVIK